jgi:outer membrane protein insertion porin family
MPGATRSLLAGVLCLAAILPCAAQSFKPKTIQFKGADGYTDQDLMAATGLQPGMTLSGPDVNARTQKLMDTGLFEGMSYKFDGADLIFQLKPAAQLYSIRLENLPLAPGPELDAKLRQRVPLYRGSVPSEGALLDDIRTALEGVLKEQGIPATLITAPYGALGGKSASAISFTISSPQVLIGEIQPDSGALDPDARKVLERVSGAAYDRTGSAAAIQRDIAEVYRDKGYLDIQAHATQLATLSIAPDAVHIPFRVSVSPGSLFKVTSIQLAPGMIVSQADFDKQAHTHPGDIASAEHIAENWRFIERQYHNHGYMKAQVTPAATLDHAAATVSYTVTAVPGAVYSMGKLTIENVSDDLRAGILKAWKMPEGAVFNEGAILSFFATRDVNPQLERIFAVVKIKYTLHLNDDTHTVDTTIRLEKRP